MLFLIASFPFLNIAATLVLPITLARCSPTVSICIFLAKGLLIRFTLVTVFLASVGVANLILTVSLGFSSVYNLLPEPFGFLPVPFTEGQPQVLIESLIRERPVIVFNEIQHVCQNYKGIFVVDRNPKNLIDIIQFIDKNYEQILIEMKRNKYPTKENFLNQLDQILKTGV